MGDTDNDDVEHTTMFILDSLSPLIRRDRATRNNRIYPRMNEDDIQRILAMQHESNLGVLHHPSDVSNGLSTRVSVKLSTNSAIYATTYNKDYVLDVLKEGLRSGTIQYKDILLACNEVFPHNK